MADLTDYISSISIGTSVSEQTGKGADGFVAGGYAAFIQALTGKPPTVIALPNRRASIALDSGQRVIMQQFLDKQLSVALSKPKTPPSLQIDLGPVLVPWALKYAVPAAVLLVLLGWVGHWYMVR